MLEIPTFSWFHLKSFYWLYNERGIPMWSISCEVSCVSSGCWSNHQMFPLSAGGPHQLDCHHRLHCSLKERKHHSCAHPLTHSCSHPCTHAPTHSFIHSLFHHACMHALNHIIHLIASSSPSSLFITSMLWSSSIKIQKPHLYWPNKFPKSPCSSIISYFSKIWKN